MAEAEPAQQVQPVRAVGQDDPAANACGADQVVAETEIDDKGVAGCAERLVTGDGARVDRRHVEEAQVVGRRCERVDAIGLGKAHIRMCVASTSRHQLHDLACIG